ncbi:hypothetical protein Y1Q_0001934 [Alligator mississippiensis]|uniref:Uncharacterized protein n=1 Tax=Alligator mississippiensis TaxID=8496 RepID=A0A151PGH1_ALLMI|nr:hypothetical protein Y1Q_0001934 [Alligator mississippiensis]
MWVSVKKPCAAWSPVLGPASWTQERSPPDPATAGLCAQAVKGSAVKHWFQLLPGPVEDTKTCRTWLQQHAAFGLKTALATYLAAVCGLHETQLPSILAAATSWHNTGHMFSDPLSGLECTQLPFSFSGSPAAEQHNRSHLGSEDLCCQSDDERILQSWTRPFRGRAVASIRQDPGSGELAWQQQPMPESEWLRGQEVTTKQAYGGWSRSPSSRVRNRACNPDSKSPALTTNSYSCKITPQHGSQTSTVLQLQAHPDKSAESDPPVKINYPRYSCPCHNTASL